MLLVGLALGFATLGGWCLSRDLRPAAYACFALAVLALLPILVWMVVEAVGTVIGGAALAGSLATRRGRARPLEGRDTLRQRMADGGVRVVQPHDLRQVGELTGGLRPRVVLLTGQGEVTISAAPWRAAGLRAVHQALQRVGR